MTSRRNSIVIGGASAAIAVAGGHVAAAGDRVARLLGVLRQTARP